MLCVISMRTGIRRSSLVSHTFTPPGHFFPPGASMMSNAIAGVLFTANPLTGQRRQAVIDASPGLGEAIVSGANNVLALVAGHLHRQVVTRFAGTALIVCPSTAPQVALDLGQIDPEVPDERPMIVADPPGYALHLWTGRALLSHFDRAEPHDVVARFGPGLQPLVRLLAAERERR